MRWDSFHQAAQTIQQEIKREKLPAASVMFGGDSNVGKTSMFLYYFRGESHPEYVPIKVEADHGPIVYTYKESGKKVGIYYNDCDGGGEDWHRLRPLGYDRADVVVLCFSIRCRRSFENIDEYWYPMVQKHAPKAPIVLCGTKLDTRFHDNGPAKT